MLKENRICGKCTACCEGWLEGEAYGHPFFAGTKCYYLGERCTIYNHRPEHPCKSYRCVWLDNSELPEWLRPDRCGAIFTLRQDKDIHWIEIKEAGKRLDVVVLSWAVMNLYVRKGINLRYQIDSGWNWIGSNDFAKLMQGE